MAFKSNPLSVDSVAFFIWNFGVKWFQMVGDHLLQNTPFWELCFRGGNFTLFANNVTSCFFQRSKFGIFECVQSIANIFFVFSNLEFLPNWSARFADRRNLNNEQDLRRWTVVDEYSAPANAASSEFKRTDLLKTPSLRYRSSSIGFLPKDSYELVGGCEQLFRKDVWQFGKVVRLRMFSSWSRILNPELFRSSCH